MTTTTTASSAFMARIVRNGHGSRQCWNATCWNALIAHPDAYRADRIRPSLPAWRYAATARDQIASARLRRRARSDGPDRALSRRAAHAAPFNGSRRAARSGEHAIPGSSASTLPRVHRYRLRGPSRRRDHLRHARPGVARSDGSGLPPDGIRRGLLLRSRDRLASRPFEAAHVRAQMPRLERAQTAPRGRPRRRPGGTGVSSRAG